MPEVFPFHACRYNTEKIKDISAVVTQPYDKIDQALQKKYYAAHDRNIVRIIRCKEEAGDDENSNKYTRAADYLRQWLADGTFVRDDKPAIYAYYQDYVLPGGARKTRKGFIALGELMDYGKGGVKPHEKTLAGPKADRLNLLRATQAQFGQIFMLYSDPENAINAILDETAREKPLVEAFVGDDERHRIWPITEPDKIATVQQLMRGKPLFIADGHHRYETALNYRNEMRAKGFRCEGLETFDRRMMTFVNMDDKGLTIFPTHRLIFDVPEFEPELLLKRLGDFFDIREFPFDESTEERVRTEFLEDLKVEGMDSHCLGMYLARSKVYYLLTLRDPGDIDKIISDDRPSSWKRLDVNVLHMMILEPFLGIGARELEAQTNVHYERSAPDALDKVKAGDYQLAFIMNPTKAEQVREVALAGERMPQKSTDFYPKLLTGLVFVKLNVLK
ncbi:MAG: DUF1015 domain-containing protein [Planctomycetota bacterium]|nr:MAG: DUF1015 domain-containing protein [Planctomycetota bacterium]